MRGRGIPCYISNHRMLKAKDEKKTNEQKEEAVEGGSVSESGIGS